MRGAGEGEGESGGRVFGGRADSQ